MTDTLKEKEEGKENEGSIELKTQEEEALSTIDLLDEELKMAEKHGIEIPGVSKKDEEKKEEEDENKDEKKDEDGDTEDKDKEKDEGKKGEEEGTEDEEKDEGRKEDDKSTLHSSDLDATFDKMSEDSKAEHDALQTFTPEQKSFYWKWKKDKKKRQEAVAEKEMLELKIKQLELEQNQKKEDPSLDDILSEEEKKAKLQEPVTRAEYEKDRLQEQKIKQEADAARERFNVHATEAGNRYEDLKEAIDAAEKVFAEDKKYYNMFLQEFGDPQGNAVEFAYKLGKMNLQSKGSSDTVHKKIDKKPKKQTSAALSSAPSSKVKRIKYEDMTVEEALKLSTEEWRKIPKEHKERLLRE